VRVNCVTAGPSPPRSCTTLGGDIYFDAVAKTVPLAGWAPPLDVAQACLFLASEAAAFITGANLVVHGGGDDPPTAEPDPS